METAYEQALKLYEKKEYKEAFDVLKDLLTPDLVNTKILLLTAKTFMFIMSTPLKKEMHEAFFQTLSNAYDYATTPEEYEQINYEIELAFREWKVGCVAKYMWALEGVATVDAYRTYLKFPVAFSEFTLRITLMSAEKKTQFRNRENITPEEYEKKYYIPLPEDTTDSQIRDLEFVTATAIFQNATEYLSENDSGTPEFMKDVGHSVLERYLIAKLIFDRCARSDDVDEAVLYEYYKKAIEVRYAELVAVIYPNGQACSIHLGDREETLAEMKDYVAKIQEIDPNYTIDSYPSVEAHRPAQTSSGGCYVATCVYGSYDCPEVWTLRRFRDNTLAETWYGRAFIRTYYAISPTLVKWFGKTKWFKNMWKPTLDKMVNKLNDKGVDNTAYNDKEW